MRLVARTTVLLVVLVGAGLLATACSSGSGIKVASLGSTTTTVAAAGSAQGGLSLQAVYQAQYQYAQCMRSHGVGGYPDPVLTAHAVSTPIAKIDANSPNYASASSVCKKLIPNGGPPSAAQMQAAEAAALKHSQCMRAHGVPNFPDPSVSHGGITVELPRSDLNSPAFQSATKTCEKLAPIG